MIVSSDIPLGPRPAPGLIGRAAECAAILQLLRAPGQSLVTLLGPGGIGKTSVALQIAADLAASADPLFADGATTVLLAPVAEAANVALAVAEGLGESIEGARPAADQLVAALRQRASLLGPSDGDSLAGLIRRILDEAPGVRILATSRERLKLHDERLFELGGLSLPADDSGPSVGRSEAAQLFAERAKRVAPDFSLHDHNRAAVARICRRLDGMPLAIELAAAWARALAPHEIADEIDRSLDFLAHAGRDTPPRHRSIRAALDHSWRLLDEAERQTLARMSVFRGGFDREAALEVARAGLPTLSSLLDKSLLRRNVVRGATRYTLHELVRQYAAEQLAADAAEQSAAEARHTAFYANLLQRMVEANTGATTRVARATLNGEIDNLRAAWSRAASLRDTAALGAMNRGFWVLYEANIWLLDGAALFGQAAAALRGEGSAAEFRSVLLVQQACLLSRAGRFDLVTPLLAEARALTKDHTTSAELGSFTYGLAMIEINRGQVGAAQTLLAHAATTAQGVGDQFVALWAELFLGWSARFRGDYTTAETSYRRCLESWRLHGFARGEAAALAYLGDLQRITGQHQAASVSLNMGIRIASAANDRWTLGFTLAVLGALAVAQGELDEGSYLLTEALTIIRELGGEPWMLGAILCAMGQLACIRGALRLAQQCYAEVAQLVRAGTEILSGELVYSLALLYEQAGDETTALGLLLAMEQATAEQHIAIQAARRRGVLEARTSPAQHAAARAIAQRPLAPLLEELCARPLAQPAAPPAQEEPDAPMIPSGGLYLADTGEILSPRELDVLRLLVAGATNQQIADTLIISRFTAKNHVASILQKLAVTSRTQAALRGRALGLEPLPLR